MPHRIVNFLFRLLLCMLLFSIPFKGMAQGTLSWETPYTPATGT